MLMQISRIIIQRTTRSRTMCAEFLVIPEKIGTVAEFLKWHDILEQNTPKNFMKIFSQPRPHWKLKLQKQEAAGPLNESVLLWMHWMNVTLDAYLFLELSTTDIYNNGNYVRGSISHKRWCLKVGLDDIRGLFQLEWFYDSKRG